MEKNNILKCKVIGFQEYGMFVSCGEYNGLVHISEISDQYVKNIEQIFELNDEVSLLVLEVHEDEKRLKLSYKKNHQINKRISKSVPTKIAFHSLNKQLPKWIEEKKREIEKDEVNNK